MNTLKFDTSGTEPQPVENRRRWLKRPKALIAAALLLATVNYRHQDETITYFDSYAAAAPVHELDNQRLISLPELGEDEAIPEPVGPTAPRSYAAEDDHVEVMTFNLHEGKLQNGLGPLIQILRDKKPDVACFQEATDEDIQKINRATNMHGVFNSTTTPYPGGVLQGNAILVVPDRKIDSYQTDRLPSPMKIFANAGSSESKRSQLDVVKEALWEPRGAVTLEVFEGNALVRVINAHTSYEQYTSGKHLDAFGNLLQRPDTRGRLPITIGCGDLNAQPAALEHSTIGALIPGYQFKEPKTFPAPADGSTTVDKGRTIDYVLSPHCLRTNTETLAFGSDHLGLSGSFSMASCTTVPSNADLLIPDVRQQIGDHYSDFILKTRPLAYIWPIIKRPLKLEPGAEHYVGSPR